MAFQNNQLFDISLIGDRKLRKTLGKLEQKIQRKILATSMRNAGKAVAEEAKRRVPVDSGALKRSIKVKADKFKKNPRPRPVGVAAIAGIGMEKWYASFVELGTPRMTAQPFMRPAADAKRDDVLRQLEIDIAVGIEQGKAGKPIKIPFDS